MRSRTLYNLGLLMRKPSVSARVIWNYASILAGKKRLRSVEIDLGFGCQLNCSHCYASELIDPGRRQMGMDDIRHAVDQCINEGAIHFLISGGEPLIHSHVYDVIEYVNSKNAFSCLVTNGAKLDDETIQKLAESGLDIIEISLDSAVAEKHDRNRRMEGLHKKVLEAAAKCTESGMEVFTSSVITNENINDGDLRDIIRIGREKKLRTHLCFPVATGNWKHEDIALTDKNRAKAKRLFAEEDIRCCEEGNYLRQGCSAGVEKLCINPYGDILPCPYIQASFGNILEEDLGAILKRMRSNKYFSSITGPCLPAFDKKFIGDVMDKINKSGDKPLKLK